MRHWIIAFETPRQASANRPVRTRAMPRASERRRCPRGRAHRLPGIPAARAAVTAQRTRAVHHIMKAAHFWSSSGGTTQRRIVLKPSVWKWLAASIRHHRHKLHGNAPLPRRAELPGRTRLQTANVAHSRMPATHPAADAAQRLIGSPCPGVYCVYCVCAAHAPGAPSGP